MADLRAPTPSAAAELTVFSYADYLRRIEDTGYTLKQEMMHSLGRKREQLSNLRLKLQRFNPGAMVRERRMRYVNQLEQIRQLMREKILKNRHRLEVQITQFEALSPLQRLKGGYVYASADGAALSSVSQVHAGDEILLQLRDGSVGTKVTDIRKTEQGIPDPQGV